LNSARGKAQKRLNWSASELRIYSPIHGVSLLEREFLVLKSWPEKLVADELKIRPVLKHGFRSLTNVWIFKRKIIFFSKWKFCVAKASYLFDNFIVGAGNIWKKTTFEIWIPIEGFCISTHLMGPERCWT